MGYRTLMVAIHQILLGRTTTHEKHDEAVVVNKFMKLRKDHDVLLLTLIYLHSDRCLGYLN